MPINIIFYIMKTINLLVSISLGSLFQGGGTFLTIFNIFLSIAIIFLFIGIIYAISKAVIEERGDQPQNSFKKRMLEIGKSTFLTILLVFFLPALIIILSTLLNGVTDLLFSAIGDNGALNPGGQVSDPDALFAASIVMVGYRPTDLNAFNEMRNTIALKLLNNEPLSILGGGLGSFDDWSVPISGLATILIVFAYFRLAVSLVSKVLEVYLKLLVAPLILYFKAYNPKTKIDYLRNVIIKIATMSCMLIGYRLILILYTVFQTQLIPNIIEALGKEPNSLIARLLTAFILFIGVQLVTAVPSLVLNYFFQAESVGDEWRKSQEQIRAAIQPIHTAFRMASSVIGVGQTPSRYSQSVINRATNFKEPSILKPPE